MIVYPERSLTNKIMLFRNDIVIRCIYEGHLRMFKKSIFLIHMIIIWNLTYRIFLNPILIGGLSSEILIINITGNFS